MALTLYLAMTAAEMHNCFPLPEHTAWMACHFAPYGNGISNVPSCLPAGSVLILNDRIPPCGHDPRIIASRLQQAVEELAVSRVLLDMQRPNQSETAEIVEAITEQLSCPVGVTPYYASQLSCSIFLTPQLRKPLSEQLDQWPDREIWLECVPDCEIVTVTRSGSRISAGQIPDSPSIVHTDEALRCRHQLELADDCARFTVWRDHAQLQLLLSDAQQAGITCAIGLYQQLQDFPLEQKT